MKDGGWMKGPRGGDEDAQGVGRDALRETGSPRHMSLRVSSSAMVVRVPFTPSGLQFLPPCCRPLLIVALPRDPGFFLLLVASISSHFVTC